MVEIVALVVVVVGLQRKEVQEGVVGAVMRNL